MATDLSPRTRRPSASVNSRLGQRDARGSRGTTVGIDGIASISSTFITESIASRTRVADALDELRLTGKEKEDARPRHATATTRQQNGEKGESRDTRGPKFQFESRETDQSSEREREHCSTQK